MGGESPTPSSPPHRKRADEEDAGAAPPEKRARHSPTEGGGAGASEEKHPTEHARTIETGTIQWFYRAKVEKEVAASLDDVQRFFMLLRPDKEGSKNRMCILGKKRLPSARSHERFFGFVEATSKDAHELLQPLGPATYETKTRGTRHLAGARALGQGTYAITEHKDHTALVYTLEVPSSPGQAQLEFKIGEVGSFILTVKNPKAARANDPGLEDKAEYSRDKQAEFGGYAWIPVHDTQLLDVPHCEFLLIGAKEEVPPELEQGKHGEKAGIKHAPEAGEEALIAAMRDELQAEEVGIVTEPVERTEKVA